MTDLMNQAMKAVILMVFSLERFLKVFGYYAMITSSYRMFEQWCT